MPPNTVRAEPVEAPALTPQSLRRRRTTTAALILAALPLTPQAETGITDTTITLGMSAPFHGPNGAYGLEMKEAISAAIDHVNTTGGLTAAVETIARAEPQAIVLRMAGRELSRERFVDTLEGLRQFDLGGFRVSYSPTDHGGSTFVDLTVIGEGGRVRR